MASPVSKKPKGLFRYPSSKIVYNSQINSTLKQVQPWPPSFFSPKRLLFTYQFSPKSFFFRRKPKKKVILQNGDQDFLSFNGGTKVPTSKDFFGGMGSTYLPNSQATDPIVSRIHLSRDPNRIPLRGDPRSENLVQLNMRNFPRFFWRSQEGKLKLNPFQKE